MDIQLQAQASVVCRRLRAGLINVRRARLKASVLVNGGHFEH